MNDKFETCQLFWLDIPLLHFKRKSKQEKNPRPFLICETDDTKITLLKICGQNKSEWVNRRPQHKLIYTSPDLTKKESFIDLNILVYIERNLFPNMLNDAPLKNQGQPITREEFNEIIKGVKNCFSNKFYQGNRYEVKVK